MTLFDAPTVRVRLLVAYDGSAFHGFAFNRDVPTVAGALGDAISRVLGHDVTLTAAGRTDTGVHAWGQVVSFDARADGLDLAPLQRSVNGLCGPSIAVRAIELAEPDFDARFSAIWRRYRYTVLNETAPDPFLAATTWHVEPPLDLRALRLACDPLIGEHDFSSFCRRPKTADGEPEPSLVRRVLSARWSQLEEPDHLRFEIRATAFCHQMVRAIVGTLVDVGMGKASPGDIRGILVRRDREAAGQVAPPYGLVLWEVGYP